MNQSPPNDANDGPADSSAEEFPSSGRLIGLDYGTKRIGVAVSDQDQKIAGPLENYTRRTPVLDAKFLIAIASENRAVGLVVGLPVHMSGDEGEKAKEARVFGEWVSNHTSLPVKFQDERFTSSLADAAMSAAGLSKQKRKERLDKVAAQFLLQSFLDRDERDSAPGAISG